MTTRGHSPWNRPLAAATALVAGMLVALTPALASAGPVQSPTSRQASTAGPLFCPTPSQPATSARDAAFAYFSAAYRTAPLWDKRGIHNEITSILADPEFGC
jgi:hypothetical protein